MYCTTMYKAINLRSRDREIRFLNREIRLLYADKNLIFQLTSNNSVSNFVQIKVVYYVAVMTSKIGLTKKDSTNSIS